jgi:serine/threonine protein kinase/tetratricopeptide (TPR) repeat protein
MRDESALRNPVELLAEEFLARDRRGERPSVSEYVARYPELADEIHELFPILLEMEDARAGAALASDPAVMLGKHAPRRLGDYRILREIGRGGMAVVYEAEQESLGRRVALKVLARASLTPQQVQRFHREARSAAKLHHTNIVPVFGVGCEGEVHYYVMQYIAGQPLDMVLKEVGRLRDRDQRGGNKDDLPSPCPTAHRPSAADVAWSLCSGRFVPAAASATSDPEPASEADRAAAATQAEPGDTLDQSAPIETASDALPPTHTSDVFSASSDLTGSGRRYARAVARIGAQVAEAIEYAAEQGIIHRDVKPSNILLDLHGTAWVTDFGLAKVAGQEDLTHTGDLVGTLRYMAPERFRGEADRRSDVYALGLTLYELLALRPAYDDGDRARLIRQVTETDPPPLSKLDVSIPRDLATIVHKAIAREPAKRYATAGALASDLRRFLDDRPIVARRPSLLDRAAKWSRRYRATVATGLVGFGVALAILAGSIGWIWRDRAARGELTVREVNQALLEASALQERKKFPEALEVIKRANGFVAMVRNETLHRRVEERHKDLEMVERLEAIRLPRPVGGVESDYVKSGWDTAYAAAFRNYGIDVEQLDPAEAGARIASRAIRRELTAALDHWADQRMRHQPTREAGWKRLFAAARAADPDEWRNQIRDMLERNDRQAANKLAEKAPIDDLPVQTLELLVALLDNERELSVMRRVQRRYPDDFWINFKLAWASGQNPVEAIRFYTAALAIRPRNAPTHYFLAESLVQRGQLDEAIIEYQKSIELDPNSTWPRDALWHTYLKQGKLDLVIEECRKAIQRNAADAEAHATLAHVLSLKGQNEASIREYDTALRLKPDFVSTCNNFAWILVTCPEAHLRNPRRAVALAKKAVEAQGNDGPSWNTLGVALYRIGDWQAAIKALQKSIALQGYTSFDGFFVAMAQAQLGRREEARRQFDKADRWTQTFRSKDEELRRFRAEAIELLGRKGSE